MKYQIIWYDGFGGRPNYSRREFDTVAEAVETAELAVETSGADVGYGICTAKTHRRISLSERIVG